MPRFLTCATCGPESWVRTDKVWQRPVCPWCGNAWPKRQVQVQQAQTGEWDSWNQWAQWTQEVAWDTKPNRPKRARIPAPLRKALEANWQAMSAPARKALEEAGYQPPEPATEEKDLVELLRTYEDKLPSEVIAALPSKPTLGPVEEGREVADKYAEAVRELRILGREKLDLQSRIDASKANLLLQLKKMQQLQEDICKAQDKVNQETKVYQQKVLAQTEDPDPVDLVLKALGMSGGLTDSQLTEEQKRRLEEIKEEEAKRRRVMVETPPGLAIPPDIEVQPPGLGTQKGNKPDPPEGVGAKDRDTRSRSPKK